MLYKIYPILILFVLQKSGYLDHLIFNTCTVYATLKYR